MAEDRLKREENKHFLRSEPPQHFPFSKKKAVKGITSIQMDGKTIVERDEIFQFTALLSRIVV